VADDDDEDNNNVPGSLGQVAHDENRQIIAVLTDHMLGLQAAIQVLRALIAQIWRDPLPIDPRHLLELEVWFRERSQSDRKAALALQTARREGPAK
jgi:hypothetical protein